MLSRLAIWVEGSGNTVRNNNLSGFQARIAQAYVGAAQPDDGYTPHDNFFQNNDYGPVDSSSSEAMAGFVCEGDNNQFTNENFLGNYPGWSVVNPDYLSWLGQDSLHEDPPGTSWTNGELLGLYGGLSAYYAWFYCCVNSWCGHPCDDCGFSGVSKCGDDSQPPPPFDALGCVLLGGSAKGNKVTALKNGQVLHGADLCDQVLDLPDYENETYIVGKPGWRDDYGKSVYNYPWLGGYLLIIHDSYFQTYDQNFGSAGFEDENDPTSGQAFVRTGQQEVLIIQGPFGDEGWHWLGWSPSPFPIPVQGFTYTANLVDVDPAGQPIVTSKYNDVPGYQSCLNRPEGFITAMQERAASLSGRHEIHGYFHGEGMMGQWPPELENGPWPTPEEICTTMGKTWNPTTQECEG
jgi:hypothetical protein